MQDSIIYKKRVRLRDFDYKGCLRYFVTICTRNKEMTGFLQNQSLIFCERSQILSDLKCEHTVLCQTIFIS